MPGKPFQSKLIPFTDQIKSWRRAGKTWQEVADNLADTKYLGYQMAPGPICRFMGRIKRRPYPIGAEPLTPVPAPPPTAKAGNNLQENTSRILERIREQARSKGHSDPEPPEDPAWNQPFEPEKL
jgi:hypothetical protein